MSLSQFRSKRKTTGGRYKKIAKKIRNQGNLPTLTTIGELRKTTIRARSGIIKERLLSTNIANVYDPKTKKHFKCKLENVIDNPSNRNFIRRNILTKGSIVKTDKGKIKITSRPGQEGTLNAILIP